MNTASPLHLMTKKVRMCIPVLLLVLGSFTATAEHRSSRSLRFTLEPLAFLGDPVPNGGHFASNFQPYGINNRGQVSFGTRLIVEEEDIGEAIFILTRRGKLIEVARAGNTTPEGTTSFGEFFFEKSPINRKGQVAFIFDREPVTDLEGLNAGVYRFRRKSRSLTPVMLPGDPAPGGEEFVGAFSSASINNRGKIAFAGMITGGDIDPSSLPGMDGLGVGVFVRNKRGQISSVIRPGSPAPGEGTFDFAHRPSMNDHGDVAFAAHIDLDECFSQGLPIFCLESIFLKTKYGRIISIARQGDPAPGGGIYRFATGPLINNSRQVVFVSDLSPAPDILEASGVFIYSHGKVIPIALPGDPLPGGGKVDIAGGLPSSYGLNSRGDVAFSASLVRDGVAETGIYLWSRNKVHLIAKTGTEIPGVGTIVQLLPPNLITQFPELFRAPWVGGAINDRREVVFTAAVDDGRGGPLLGILLKAEPRRRW